jgi:hypothetical protein
VRPRADARRALGLWRAGPVAGHGLRLRRLRLRGVSRATRPNCRLCPAGHHRPCRGPRASTAFAAAAPVVRRYARALRPRIAPPWSASALASQRVRPHLPTVECRRTVRVLGEARLLLTRAEATAGVDSSATREVTRRLEQSGMRSPRNRSGREECNAQAQRRCQQIGKSAHGAIPAGRPRPDRARLATAEALVRGGVIVAPPGGPRMPPDERLSRIALRSCSRAPRGSAGARRRRRRARRADIGRSRACRGYWDSRLGAPT